MTYHWWNILLVTLCGTSQIALMYLLFARREIRNWPFLFGYAFLDLLSSLSLPFIRSYATYFYAYWVLAALRSAVSLGVLWDIIRSIPLSWAVPGHLKASMLAFASTIAVGAGATAFCSGDISQGIVRAAYTMNAGASLAWFGFVMSYYLGLSFIGFAWPERTLRLGSGFLVTGLSVMLTSNAMLYWPRLSPVFGLIDTAVYLVVFFSWIKCFASPDSSSSNLSQRDIRVILGKINHV